MAVPSPYPLLKNLRTYVKGRVESRPGLVQLATIADQIHTIKRLNDDVPGAAAAFTRIVGAGTKLYSGSGALTQRDTGYSGNPLSMIQVRPEQSPESWVYVADSLRMRKIKVDGTNFQMGIAPPLNPPTATFGADARQVIENFTAIGGWTNGGTAGAITANATRFTSTVKVILYDSGNTGECSILPNALTSDLRPGMLLALTGGVAETVEVHDVLPPFTGTITSQTGTAPGPVTVHLGNLGLTGAQVGFVPQLDSPDFGLDADGDPLPIRGPHSVRFPGLRNFLPSLNIGTQGPVGFKVGTIVKVNTTGTVALDYTTIQSVSIGPDGSLSVVVNLIATQAITIFQGQTTLRAFTASNHAVGETLTATMFTLSVTQGTGFISETVAFNLSSIQGRPVQDEDEVHLSLRFDHPEFVTEVRIFLDVDVATNDFTRNYFFAALRQSDLQASVLSSLSVFSGRQAAFSRDVVGELGTRVSQPFGGVPRIPVKDWLRRRFGPGGFVPDSTQADTGASQWTEWKVKVKNLTRVGADRSRNLSNVAAIRIQFVCSGTVAVAASSFWIGGSYGPDIGDLGAPYLYRYRGRSSVTGAKSNPSPPMRNGVEPHRKQVLVNLTQHPDPQVDKLDVFRFGGSLASWIFVGWVNNTATPQFPDVYQDLDIANAPLLEFDNFQPFPTVDIPRSGTCNVVGTQVTWVSGDTFNLNWAPGMQININGVLYSLYAQPPDGTHLPLVENGGTQTGVSFFINQATILGQPLPALWGPWSQGTGLFCFACGDLFQPGVLFILKGNNPDSAPDILQMEVTSPSEPLMNGCVHDGVIFVWSAERMMVLFPSFQGGFILVGGAVTPATGTNLFTPEDVPGETGLFARWFFCIGPKVWYGTKDGIREKGTARPITDEYLYLLFPHDGQPGVPVTLGTVTVNPPDFTQSSKLRLSYSDGFLYFDYVDTQGQQTTLVYNVITKVWGVDLYALTGTNGALTHYAEEGRGVHSLLVGGSDNGLYQMSGSQDNNQPFISEIRMPQRGDFSGFLHFRDIYASILSAQGVSLILNLDGTDTLVTLPQTNTYQKSYATLPALKGKVHSIGLTNAPQTAPAPWTLVDRDELIIRAKKWGVPGAEYKDLKFLEDFSARSRIQPSQ